MRASRPSHTTVVAYLALFIALGTGASWAATKIKIKSSAQIKRGVVNGSDIKDGSVDGRDIRDAGLSGPDIADGSLAGAELAPGAIGARELAPGSIGAGKLAPGAVGSNAIADSGVGSVDVLDGGLGGVDLIDDSVKGEDVDESSLSFGKGFSNALPGSVPVDDGSGGLAVPRSPQGDIVLLALPPGRYLMLAHALIAADADGGNVYCLLNAAGESAQTGNDVSSVDFGGGDSGISGVSVSTIVSSETSFVTRFICSDNASGVSASDRGIEAIRLNTNG